jgi:hypothetical protein
VGEQVVVLELVLMEQQGLLILEWVLEVVTITQVSLVPLVVLVLF